LNCPGCNARCQLGITERYSCRICGAHEEINPAGKGTIWFRAGVIIAAPEIEKEQLETAKRRGPQGKWKKSL